MIDLHCHVLPGVDDGPASMEESVALARVAESVGIETLVATPHVSFDMRTHSGMVETGVEMVAARIAAEGIGVTIRPGGEVDAAWAAGLDDGELARLRLGGGEWLLVECPLARAAPGFEVVVRSLQARGHRIVLAHPERSPVLRRDPRLLRSLVRQGMLSSVTAASLVGRFGREVREFSFALVEEELVHNVTSDAHDPVGRAPELRGALVAADADLPGLADRIDWLTVQVPAAILDGGSLPPPPGPTPRRPPPRRGLLRRRSRSR